MCALANLNEVLFNNNDKIPEGLYLELMNLTKDIFNEQCEKQIIRVRETTIRYTDPKIYHLRNIQPIFLPNRPRYVALFDSRLFRIGHNYFEGDCIELLAYGNDKIFLEIRKINKCSIVCVKHIFIWSMEIGKYRLENWVGKIKCATKYELNDIGVMFEDLRGKKIEFYDFPSNKIQGNYIECMENEVDYVPPPTN